MSPPSCSVMHVESDCPPLHQCFLSNWSVYLTVKDRGHSGLARIQLAAGQGTLMLLHEEASGKNENSLMQLPEKTYVNPLRQLHDEATRNQLHRHRRLKHSAQRLVGDRLVPGDPPLNISEWAGRKHIMLHYTSDCCVPRVELFVWDKADNMRNCSLTASQQRALREKNRAATGIKHTVFTLVLWTLLGLDANCA